MVAQPCGRRKRSRSPRNNAGAILQIIHRTDDLSVVIKDMASGAKPPGDFSDRQSALAALDIVERVKLHLEDCQNIRRSEAMPREAQRLGEIGSWTTDLTGADVVWSDLIFTHLGRDRGPKPLTFAAFYALVHPDDRSAFMAARALALADDVKMNVVHRIMKPDGKVRVMRHLGERQPLLPGGAAFAGTMQDITTLHAAALQTTEALDLLRIAGGVARMGAWRHALTQDVIHFTDVTAAILELDPGTDVTVEQTNQFYAPRLPRQDACGFHGLHNSGCAFR